MDVRLSPEQVALCATPRRRWSTASACMAVADLDDRERAMKLDAAVDASGWRELRTATEDGTAPWASAVEVAIVAEELGRGLADAPFLGATMAAELRRLAGAPPATEPETVAWPRRPRRRWPRSADGSFHSRRPGPRRVRRVVGAGARRRKR